MMTESNGAAGASSSRSGTPLPFAENDAPTIGTNNSPFTTSLPNQNSAAKGFPNPPDLTQVTAKIESLKKWTLNTYKTTKHSINEQLGKVKRTVDKDLEERIEALRDLQRRYQEILASSRGFTNHFYQANNMQRSLAEAVYQLSCKEDVLNNEFAHYGEALRIVSQQAEIFIGALNSFISTLETVADKTIQDTLFTVDHHDQARLEYDAYRCELENLQLHPNTNASLSELEEKCNELKTKYDQLKEDVRVKLTLLEENRCKVMRRQIAVIQQALVAYHSGSAEALQSEVEQLRDNSSSKNNICDADPMRPPLSYDGNSGSSFLER